MKKLLRRLGLLDSFTIQLRISSHDFVTELNKITEKNQLVFFLQSFSGNQKEFIAQISESKFEISKPRTGLLSITHLARAYGKTKQQGEKLIVDVDIYLKQAYFVVIGFGLVTAMFFLFGLMFLTGSVAEGNFNEGIIGAAAFWGFTILFVGGPLLMMRLAVSNLWIDVHTNLADIGNKKRPEAMGTVIT